MGSLMKPWMVVPALVGVLAAGQIWFSHLRYELSLEVQSLSSEKQGVLRESSKLRLELASMIRPERLRKLAQERLGMGPPSPAQVVHL